METLVLMPSHVDAWVAKSYMVSICEHSVELMHLVTRDGGWLGSGSKLSEGLFL